MDKKTLIVTTVFAGISLMGGNTALAQDPGILDDDIKLFRKDLRSLKK